MRTGIDGERPSDVRTRPIPSASLKRRADSTGGGPRGHPYVRRLGRCGSKLVDPVPTPAVRQACLTIDGSVRHAGVKDGVTDL
jgi:hypothetical protein